MTADRSTDPLWQEETADRAKDWERESCPNDADPVLCKIQPDGMFVPEAGCPEHDPTPVWKPCRCGHAADHHGEWGCTGMAGTSLCKCSRKGVAS